MKIDGSNEPQLVPKLLLQVSVRELHNNLVSATIDGGIKESIDEDDNIIISDATLRSLLPPQLDNFHQDTRSCVVLSVVYIPKVYIPHYLYYVIVI